MKPSKKPNKIVTVGDGFWNVRASLKIGGVLDVGTQMSLVRLASGKYVMLDACPVDEATGRFIDGKTDGGRAIEAVLHLHPFHTLFVRSLHERYPNAKLYGTARHRQREPELPWQPESTEHPSLHKLFADDLDFTVPRGVDFIPSNENLHFASVLVLHRASKTLHVDDTLNYVGLPWPLRVFKRDVLAFHPSLKRVLERRSGAANEFRQWTRELLELARGTENLCAAHMSVLLGRDAGGPSIAARVEAAVHRIGPKLVAHEQRFR